MSSQIFYSKTPIRANQPAPAFVSRLKSLADNLRRNGEEEILRDKRASVTKQYSKDGITATYDKYYEDKTITVADVGVVHYSMNRSESYFDINVNKLNETERKLGINTHARRKAA